MCLFVAKMAFMKALLLTAMILSAAVSPTLAQKKSTWLGDLVIGELTRKDEATREITIKYPGKEGPELFTGILSDATKLRAEDGTRRDMTLSEFVPGMHIRVFYKSGREKVNGQERKINKISSLEFLGNDEYWRLRFQLNVDPSTIVAPAEKDELPAKSPLKVYPATAFKNIHEYFVESIDEWNRKKGDSLGKLEVVAYIDQADILLVAAPGADTMVAVIPDINYVPGDDTKRAWAQATLYLVVKEPGGLKVLWTRVTGILFTEQMNASPRSFDYLIAELEKRMKARSRTSKK